MDSLLDTQTYNPARHERFHDADVGGQANREARQAARKRRGD